MNTKNARMTSHPMASKSNRDNAYTSNGTRYDTRIKVQGFIFTWTLAIATGYGIIHWLMPLIAR